MSEPVRAPDAALNDEDDRWLETVLASLPERSSEAKKALLKALRDGEGSMPLLGLELTKTENKQENADLIEDSNQQTMLAPLLGTTTFQHTETLGKSSERRSLKRVCYGNLLREDSSPSARKSQRTVINDTSGCYGNLLRELPQGVLRRGRNLYYRKTLPVDVQRLLNRAEIWRSLRTESLTIAVRRLPSIVAQIEAEIENARAQAGMRIDETLLQPFQDDVAVGVGHVSAPLAQGHQVVRNVTLAEAYQCYVDDPTRAWSASTREAYETSRRLAIAVLGEHLPITSISRAHCRDILEVLRFLPANAGKLFPTLTPREASDRARLRGDIKIISAANANSLMSNISSFLNWAVNEELLARNPARGLRLPDPIRKRDKRLPFSPHQLQTIFNAPLYRGCVDGERGYNKIGDVRPRNARFWVPLIALFSGARLGEITSLDTTDIRLIDGVSCIIVSQRSLVGSTDKHLKTASSDRVIPIHPKLIECGFVAFAAAKRKAGETKLFSDIETGSTGSRPVAFSKWFTQFLRSSGAQQPRTSFHSFRHNFRDELRAARVDHEIAMLLGGWTTGSSHRAVSENYGSGFRVEALNEAVMKLTFEQVDVGHLAASAR